MVNHIKTMNLERNWTDRYLDARIQLVWIIDTHRRTVTVHRPDADPELITARQELTAESHLAGFRVAVRELFE